MTFLRKLLGNEKSTEIKSYDDFWKWFQGNESAFHNVVKSRGNIERDFFNKLSPKLSALNDGYFYLTGMLDETTAELVFTADGKIKNFVFVEELVQSAPLIKGWKFTAHKPETANMGVNMGEYKFSEENLSFYPNAHTDYPDEIDITVVHNAFRADNKDAITNGTFIFLDNFLGELNFATIIDSVRVGGTPDHSKDLVPVKKLKDYLTWRQKEFVEKYQGVRYDTQNDTHSVLEAQLDNGNPLIAVINGELLRWDRKASHPWILIVEIGYGKSNNGMPDKTTYALLDEVEECITTELKDVDGYLNIGRETGNGVREIYFACKDFRRPSRIIRDLTQTYAGQIAIKYDIYKDKYWRSFDRFGMIK